jgi:glutaredoxin
MYSLKNNIYRSIGLVMSIAASSVMMGLSAQARPISTTAVVGDGNLPPAQLIAEGNEPRRFGSGRMAKFRHIDTVSGDPELALVDHLAKNGVKFYGAYWCSHCFVQKTLFGADAAAKLPYVECASDGENAQSELCKQQNVHRFPTWSINGKLYVGTRNLKDIAEMTGYKGPKDFRYSR